MTETKDLICFHCKYWLPFEMGCKAFPNGIPDIILRTNKHRRPLDNQTNHLIFEPDPEKGYENLESLSGQNLIMLMNAFTTIKEEGFDIAVKQYPLYAHLARKYENMEQTDFSRLIDFHLGKNEG